MGENRGRVTKVTFYIEYPDGSLKESTVAVSSRLNAVLLSDDYMDDEMKKLFNVSQTDWKKNPAMIIVDGTQRKPNCDYPDCQNA